MKQRLLSFLSLSLLIGTSAWAQTTDLAEDIQKAKPGGTVKLSEDVSLTQTIKIDKKLTIDLNGHNIEATDCRVFHVIAGDVTIKNSVSGGGKISSARPANGSLDKQSSVIRVGDGSKKDVTETKTNVKLTINKGVKVSTTACYGISVFGSKTNETLIVNGEVSTTASQYDGAAIAGNGNGEFNDVTITIGKTGKVTTEGGSAIYHPQNGTLNVYGTVGSDKGGGGIEAKAGTINIYDGAKIYGADSTSHSAYGNGYSTKGYAIAVVNNKNYTEGVGAHVTIDNVDGVISGAVAIVDDDNDTNNNKGTITISKGYFENCGDCKLDESLTTKLSKIVSSNGTRYYNDANLADDIKNAKSGATITLNADVNLTNTIKIDKDLTIDLNGHDITATNTRAFHVVKGNVTFKNSVTGKLKRISSVRTEDNEKFTYEYSVIRVGDNLAKDETKTDDGVPVSLTIDKYVRVESAICYGISIFGNKTKETLTVNGSVQYTGNDDANAISGNGQAQYAGTTITINKGASVLSTNRNAIYHPQAGVLNVYGTVGTSNAGGGIEAKAGTINIYDGAVVLGKQDTGNVTHQSNGNGCSTTGYAIAVVDNGGYAGNTKVSINNPSGRIEGLVDIVKDNPSQSNEKAGSIVISSGRFDYSAPKDEFIKEGKYLAKSEKSNWVLDSENDVVAKIGGMNYGNIASAYTQWGENDTLILNKDVDYALKKTITKKNLTLDLNGHKYTYSGTDVMAFHVQDGASLTIIDSKGTGSIEVTGNKAKSAVYVGSTSSPEGVATLVINGGKFVGKDFAISGNGNQPSTDITINGGEFSAKVAAYIPQMGKLTINGGTFTGTQTGVEVRSGELNITGGKFVSKSAKSEVVANGNGSTTKGYALAISQHTTKNDIKATITGGTFTGYNGICVVNPQNNETENVAVTISGVSVSANIKNHNDAKALVMAHAGGKLIVTGGKFKGGLNFAEKTTSLLGGSFTAEPADSLIAEGYHAVYETEAAYPYQVCKKIVAAVADDVPIETSGVGDTATDEEKTAAKDAVTATVKNEAVSNIKPNTEEAISKEVTTDDGKTLEDIVAEKIDEGVNAKDITAVETSIAIELKSAGVQTKKEGETEVTTAVVTKMVFDIKPVAVAFVGEKEVAKVDVPNAMITKKIKFRLPIDMNATSTYAKIEHQEKDGANADNLGLFTIQTDDKGNKYVEVESNSFSLFTVSLSDAKSMKAYVASKEAKDVPMDADSWAKELEAAPNAIAIVSSDNAEFAQAEGVKNVLIEYAAGKQKKVYECPNFVLTDMRYFYTPVNFTALKGSYERVSNNLGSDTVEYNYNSVCLPFALTSNMLSSTASINTFSYYNGTNTVLFNKVEGVTAGMPCIVWEKKNTEWNVEFNNTEIVAAPINDGNMKGAFIRTNKYGKNGKETTDYYSVNDENMFQTLADDLYPFRSCLYIHSDVEIGTTQSRSLRIDIIDDGTTDIDSVEGNAATDNGVYTLNGVKVSSSTKNLPEGIYIQNGKKVVIK